MTTPAEIAISLGMLTLIAGGSLIYWVALFLRGDKAEKEGHSGDGTSSAA